MENRLTAGTGASLVGWLVGSFVRSFWLVGWLVRLVCWLVRLLFGWLRFVVEAWFVADSGMRTTTALPFSVCLAALFVVANRSFSCGVSVEFANSRFSAALPSDLSAISSLFDILSLQSRHVRFGANPGA